QGAFRPGSGQHTHPDVNTQQHARQLYGAMAVRDRAVTLAGTDAASKEFFYVSEYLGDDLPKLRIMRGHLQRRVYNQAASPLLIVQGALNGFRKKGAYRLRRGERCLQLMRTGGKTGLHVIVERAAIQGSLVAKRV